MLILKPLFKKFIKLQAYLEANYKLFHLYNLFTTISSFLNFLFHFTQFSFFKGEISSYYCLLQTSKAFSLVFCRYTGMYCKYLFFWQLPNYQSLICLRLWNPQHLRVRNYKGPILICFKILCLYLHELEHGSCWTPPGEYPGCWRWSSSPAHCSPPVHRWD
jgi:hypothetical protein